MLFKTVSLDKAQALLRWACAIRQMLFVLPVIILIYQYKGLTVGDFFLLQGIFAFAVFFFEVPTGYIGDLFSRKKVIVISFFVNLLGSAVIYFFRGFSFIMLGEMLMALSASLFSGTGEAYLYDVLKKQGKENEMVKALGRNTSYAICGTAIATVLGGFIYHYLGPDNTVLASTTVISIASVMTLFLPDISDVKRVVAKGKSKWKDILEISSYASTHHEIKWLMLYPAAFGAGTLILMWGMQPLMEKALIPTMFFGIFMGLLHFFRAIFSHFSGSILKKMKTNGFSLTIFVFLFLGLAAASALPDINETIWVYAGLVVMCVAAGTTAPLNVVTSSMINHRIKSDERATVLSVKSMFSRMFTGTAMVSLKFMLDGYGLQPTFATVGLVILVLTAISLVKLLRLKL